MYLPEKKVAVVKIPKCGSTSLMGSVPPALKVEHFWGYATLEQLKCLHDDITVGLTVTREPMSRLQSAVNYVISFDDRWRKLSLLKNAVAACIKKGEPRGLSITFYPQYSFIVSDLPAKLYSIDNMSGLLSDLGLPNAAPKLNASKPTISREEIIESFGLDFINELYSIDFYVWQDMQSQGGKTLQLENAREYLSSAKQRQQ
jgi:hypothetical protein